MNDDIDYDQLIAEIRAENARMIAEWQQEALEQFKNKFGPKCAKWNRPAINTITTL
ncbi:hypothetical protein [Paenibacillus sp. HJGM_3]|uniref:hypothetical protein n=1 Tax=Paenibacillus sp. HJGM_3 TaxID=3379816 RepID=UPI00385EB93C